MDKLMLYLAYPFVRYALIVGVLIALCSSLLGVTLVLKRYSFNRGRTEPRGLRRHCRGLSAETHQPDGPGAAGDGGMRHSAAAHTDKIRISRGTPPSPMLSVGSLAVGYLLMNRFLHLHKPGRRLCSTLFGSTSILTLRRSEVWLCAVLSVAVVICFIFFYNKIIRRHLRRELCPGRGHQNGALQPHNRGHHRGHHCAGHEPGGLPSDLGAGHFPPVGHAAVRSFLSVTVCSAVLSVVCALGD